MISHTDDHISVPATIVSSGYVVNLGGQSFTSEIPSDPIRVASEATELHKAYDNLKRRIRQKKFEYGTSPFWSSEPLD